jgi:RNase H-fold protein (predicted Holliday junction resolvase)
MVLWDERYVSKYAASKMRDIGISSNKGDIDRISAAIILDEYLESKRA